MKNPRILLTLLVAVPTLMWAGCDDSASEDPSIPGPASDAGSDGGGGASSDGGVDADAGEVRTTHTYYLSLTGSGSNAGDTGTWEVAPTSAANAMSADNFNDEGNWSDDDIPELMDEGDIVYVVGEDWPIGNHLTPLRGVTLDFYEAGDFDPFDENHKSLSPTFASKIYVEVNHVGVVDGRFPVRVANVASVDTSHHHKIVGLRVLRNYFEIPDQTSSLQLNFVCDSDFSFNWFWMHPDTQSSYSECDASQDGVPGGNPNNHQGRSMWFKSGSRNRFTNNVVEGGYTALIAIHKRVFWGADAADWGDPYYDDHLNLLPGDGYHIDPDHSMVGNEIAYNTVYRFCHEGISNDNGATGDGDGDYGPVVVEWDVVTAVETNGDGNMVVTLEHDNWSNEENVDRYSGYYMVSMREHDDGFGQSSIIRSHGTDKKFVLDDPLDHLAAGDHVSIGLVYKNNWVHHNRYYAPRDDVGHDGYDGSAMTMEGMALGNLYEHNSMNDSGVDASNANRGMSSLALWSYAVRPHSDEVTHSLASQPQSFNIFRDNTSYGILYASFNKNYRANFPDRREYECRSRNNAVYGNHYHDHSGAGLNLTRLGSVYLGNGADKAYDKIVNQYEPGTVLTVDPTTETEATVYGASAPGVRSASISGNLLTLVLTKPCTGHDGFYLQASGGDAVLSEPAGDGVHRTYTLSRSISGETVTLGYTPGDVVDGSGVAMYEYIGVDVDN